MIEALTAAACKAMAENKSVRDAIEVVIEDHARRLKETAKSMEVAADSLSVRFAEARAYLTARAEALTEAADAMVADSIPF